MELENNVRKVAIVTGASEGIGKAISLALLGKGYRVVMVSRNTSKLHQAIHDMDEYSDQAWPYPADLTDSHQVNGLIDAVYSRESRIDVLVNNLGKGIKRQLVETTDEDWDYLVGVNLTSAFYACRAVLTKMRIQKNGRIVNIASRAGRRGEGDFAAYSALKHGLIGLTQALAESEGSFGICVNAIAPGPVSSLKMKQQNASADHSRSITPEDVAETVLFFLSEPAGMMNGQMIDLF